MMTPRHFYTRLTAARRDAFLAHLAARGNVTAAADAIGVTRIALYKLKDRDTAFEEAWTLALDCYAESLEANFIGACSTACSAPYSSVASLLVTRR